jgi:5'-AMP-activated protein kinase catalytic alpha subunit
MSYLSLNYSNNSDWGEKNYSFSAKNFNVKKIDPFIIKQENNDNNKKKETQFILGKKIGQGTFATVRLATHIKTNEIVAIKILEKEKMKEIDKIRSNREIKILKKMRHRNIVHLYNDINTEKLIYLIMEYVKGKELLTYINEKNKLNENESCYYFQQIISGIEYLEKLKIVHRDIKLENIIIEDNKNIKILDFGLSNFYQKNNILYSSCGSLCYASPEMVEGKKYSGSCVDIWSSGIVLFAMLCGYLPFTDSNEQKLFKKIVEGKLYFPHFLSEQAKDLLNKVLTKDPLKRITINKIKKHPWFNLNNPKITMSPGFLINEIVIPIDLDIINKMVNIYGYNEKEIKIDLLKNKHNNRTTTYYLLLDSKIRKGESSICDMKSDEYNQYINNPNNLLSNYNYDIDKVIDDRIYVNEKTFNLKLIKRNNNSFRNSQSNLSLKIKNNKREEDNINDNIFKVKINLKKNIGKALDNKEEIKNKNNKNQIIEFNNSQKYDEIDEKNSLILNNVILKNKKRNLSQGTRNKKNKFVINKTTYYKKLKRDNLSKDKNDKKESIITILEEKYNIKEKLEKNKNTINHKLDDKSKKNNSISKSKLEKKSRTKSSLINKKRIIMNKNEDNDNIFSKKKSGKITVNINNINGKKNENKFLINKKTEKLYLENANKRLKVLMKSSLTETNEKMRNNKSSLKNQIKKNEFLNTTNEENHINKNKKIKDNNIKNKNEEPTQKIIIKKRLFVKLKNSEDNNFSSKKKKSFNKNEKKYNSAEEKEKNNNKTYYSISGDSKENDKKKDNEEQNLYYKKLKTIDLKIKKLRENKGKDNKISLNKEMKNNLKGRAESLKEKTIKKEDTNIKNKRKNTNTSTLKESNSKERIYKNRINKRYNNNAKYNNIVKRLDKEFGN